MNVSFTFRCVGRLPLHWAVVWCQEKFWVVNCAFIYLFFVALCVLSLLTCFVGFGVWRLLQSFQPFWKSAFFGLLKMTKLDVNKTLDHYFRVNVEMNYAVPSTYYSLAGRIWWTNIVGWVFAAAILKKCILCLPTVQHQITLWLLINQPRETVFTNICFLQLFEGPIICIRVTKRTSWPLLWFLLVCPIKMLIA